MSHCIDGIGLRTRGPGSITTSKAVVPYSPRGRDFTPHKARDTMLTHSTREAALAAVDETIDDDDILHNLCVSAALEFAVTEVSNGESDPLFVIAGHPKVITNE
jgi:hypothetical protein